MYKTALLRAFVASAIGAVIGLVMTWAAQGAESPADKAGALVNDGITKYQAGDLDGALADFSKAIDENKDLAQGYYGRAGVQFVMGKFTDASDTLQKWVDKSQDDQFAWMWAYIANARGGNADRATLSQMEAVAGENSWLGMTLPLFLGTTTPEQYEAAMKDMGASQGKRAAESLAVRTHFMEGEATLLAGDRGAAAKHFKAAVELKGPFRWEREMARSELKRIEKPTAAETTPGK